MWLNVRPVDNTFVRNRSVGQDLCLNLDNTYVRRRRKSLIFNDRLDSIYVRHHLWCGTKRSRRGVRGAHNSEDD